MAKAKKTPARPHPLLRDWLVCWEPIREALAWNCRLDRPPLRIAAWSVDDLLQLEAACCRLWFESSGRERARKPVAHPGRPRFAGNAMIQRLLACGVSQRRISREIYPNEWADGRGERAYAKVRDRVSQKT